MAKATDLLLTVGNYGDDFASCKLGLSLAGRIKCSNFIGQTLSDAISLGFRRVLLIGHIGKLVKLGAGIMNTHSATGVPCPEAKIKAWSRMETTMRMSRIKAQMTSPSPTGGKSSLGQRTSSATAWVISRSLSGSRRKNTGVIP